MPNPQEEVLKGREEETRKAAGGYNRELQDDIAGETLSADAGDDAKRRRTNGEKEDPDTVGANPKRTENSRPD